LKTIPNSCKKKRRKSSFWKTLNHKAMDIRTKKWVLLTLSVLSVYLFVFNWWNQNSKSSTKRIFLGS